MGINTKYALTYTYIHAHKNLTIVQINSIDFGDGRDASHLFKQTLNSLFHGNYTNVGEEKNG